MIIEAEQGRSIAAGGVVSWCNPIDDTTHSAFELGIRFYRSIDASVFAQQVEEDADAA